MSNTFKDNKAFCMQLGGEAWGLFTTDSFGMVRLCNYVWHSIIDASHQGMDVLDVQLVVQWQATCMLSTMWQQFSHGGHDRSLKATTIFLVEKDHFDETWQKKVEIKKQKCSTHAATALPNKHPHREISSMTHLVNLALMSLEVCSSMKRWGQDTWNNWTNQWRSPRRRPSTLLWMIS